MEKFNRNRKIASVFIALILIGLLIVACTKKSNEAEDTKDNIKASEEKNTKDKNSESSSKNEAKEKEVNKDKKTTKDSNKTDKKESGEKDSTIVVKEDSKKDEKDKSSQSSSKETSKKTDTSSKKITKSSSKKEENSTTNKPGKSSETASKPSTSQKENKPSTGSNSGSKKANITTKNITEYKSIGFKTIDNYSYTGAKSRTYQEGREGQEETTIKITYSDGVETKREVISTRTVSNPQNRIIERYVKVRDRVVKTVLVENPDDPIVEYTKKPRWFVKNQSTNEVSIFYSAEEAQNYYVELGNQGFGTNWGTYEDEVTETIVGYYKTLEKEEVVQEEVFEWKH